MRRIKIDSRRWRNASPEAFQRMASFDTPTETFEWPRAALSCVYSLSRLEPAQSCRLAAFLSPRRHHATFYRRFAQQMKVINKFRPSSTSSMPPSLAGLGPNTDMALGGGFSPQWGDASITDCVEHRPAINGRAYQRRARGDRSEILAAPMPSVTIDTIALAPPTGQ